MSQIQAKLFAVLNPPSEPAEPRSIYLVQPDESDVVNILVTDGDGYVFNVGNAEFVQMVMAALMALKAPLASPELTGTPTAPTADPGTTTEQIANCEFVGNEVSTAVAALVGAAPETLDTIEELAAIIADADLDTLVTALAAKEATANKDTSGGYVGKTLEKINFWNAARTFKSFLVNAATAARTYTFPDRDGTIADDTDLALKANLASPAFTGNPTVPNQTAGDNSTKAANTAYVATAIANLVASSPSALDTLNELAAALGNDANFATTVTNALALKAPLASPTFTGSPLVPTLDISNTDTTLARVAAGILGVEGETINGYAATATAAGTTTLTVSAARVQMFTGGTTQTVKLPTTSVVNGQTYVIVNTSTGLVTVQSSGANDIVKLGLNQAVICRAIQATPTSAAHWVYEKINVNANTNGKRILVVTQSATPAINTNNGDIVQITGLAQAITSMSSSLTGSPVAGDMLELQLTDNGTGRAITWGASFGASTVALPTTTVASTMLRILFQYDTVWRCVGVA